MQSYVFVLILGEGNKQYNRYNPDRVDAMFSVGATLT